MANSNDSPDPELDSLLDDALEDFSKPVLPPPAATSIAPSSAPTIPGLPVQPNGGMLTEEVIQQATQNFEANMRAIMMQQQKIVTQQASQPLSDGLAAQFDVGTLTAEFAKFAEAASKVAGTDSSSSNSGTVGASISPAPSPSAPTVASGSSQETPAGPAPDFQNLLTNVMQQMAQNNQELQSEPSADDVSQMLAGLGLGGAAPGAAGGADGEAGGLFPLMQTMLENILSKDILYPPIKEIVDKYPDWLADNRGTVDTAEFDRYSRQFDIMKKVVELFESENESDSDEVKAKRFEDLVNLMQRLQEEGHPPTALAGDASSGNLADLLSANRGAGLPDFSASGMPQPGPGEEQCCVM